MASKKQNKKVVASENKMENGATDNQSVALLSKEEAVKQFRVIKEYDGVEVGTICSGNYQYEEYMLSNGYWERMQ